MSLGGFLGEREHYGAADVIEHLLSGLRVVN
jgi:hypothetical protein